MATAAYINGYRQYTYADFSGGLNLRDKADTVGDREAIDLLNVTFNERGAIMQRDGFADLGDTDLTNRVDSLGAYYRADGLRQLVAGCGTRLDVLDVGGHIDGSLTGLLGGPWSFVRFAAPGSEHLYAANGLNTPQRWDGSAWVSGDAIANVDGVAGRAMPKAGSLAVTATVPGDTSGSNASNRLIATAFGTQGNGGPGGAPTNPSRWYASNPGQPERWETDGAAGPPVRGRNFGDLTPGDGEQIMAAVTWRELVFIFKETKFFVLWGESTAADGTPIFNFREVVNSVGLASRLAVTVGRDGVYFFNRRGVYRTSGGNPELLSDRLDPLWTGNPADYYRGDPINLGQLGRVRLHWLMEQLFVAVPTGVRTVNDRMLVYDTEHKWWTVYDIAASALAGFRRADQAELHHGYASGPQRVGHRSFGSVTDRGQPITSRWRSGWSDYASSQVKTIRETRAWGRGAVRASFSADYQLNERGSVPMPFTVLGDEWTYAKLTAADGTYAQLGATYTSYANLTGNVPAVPQIGDWLARYAIRGVVFSTEFANDPLLPYWSVHRVARHMREIREPSIA